jgi:hypothetical protein
MWKDKLKQAWDENPLAVISVATAAVIAATAVVNTVSQARSRHAYARQVDYRIGR